MKNIYETVFISTPVLSPQQVKETVNDFKNFIESRDGKITHEEDWGIKKLAYSIKKRGSGFYYLMQFEADGEVIDKLSVQFKRDARILRHLTVKMDKHAIAYSEKRIKKQQEKKED
jgi:small subunit ribosomal protein S6